MFQNDCYYVRKIEHFGWTEQICLGEYDFNKLPKCEQYAYEQREFNTKEL